MQPEPPALVSTAWLAQRLQAPDIVVLDGSYHLPGTGRDARAEYRGRHIPGARFFDIDRIADPESPLPHMLPDERQFAAACGALGIGNETQVVVYDTLGLFSAARVWWMLRVFGHRQVSVLDGGLPTWLREGRAVSSEIPAAEPRRLEVRLQGDRVRDVHAVLANLESGAEQIVDARAAERFHGAVPEPREGLRSGHIPGARNVPFTQLLDDSGVMRPAGEIREVFREAGVDLSRPVVTSCGSGVTACVLILGLHLLGHGDNAVYDGSWSEWGARDDTPVEC